MFAPAVSPALIEILATRLSDTVLQQLSIQRFILRCTECSAERTRIARKPTVLSTYQSAVVYGLSRIPYPANKVGLGKHEVYQD